MNKANPTLDQLRKAAPEMYEALKGLFTELDYDAQREATFPIELLTKARDALAKAEGKEEK